MSARCAAHIARKLALLSNACMQKAGFVLLIQEVILALTDLRTWSVSILLFNNVFRRPVYD